MKTFPKPLSPQEEREYLERYEEGDQEARNVLIERNMRLVAHVVKKYQYTDYDMEDLISVGTIGLIKAVNTFHVDRGSRLATYAAKCIENAILSQRRQNFYQKGHPPEGNNLRGCLLCIGLKDYFWEINLQINFFCYMEIVQKKKQGQTDQREEQAALGKIVLLVSREEMLHQAHNILQEKEFRIEEMRVIATEHAVMEARKSIADGATIIIARGLQASLMKQYTNIPIVEIVLTAQEMALLIMRAKQIVKKARPVIGIVGFPNMFCDMSYFHELYEVELRTYYASQGSELADAARAAVEDHVDLMIGGDTAVSVAASAGILSLFLSMTEDSMRQAFSMAEGMDYAMSVEKKTAAQMETLLDYSFSGVLWLDSSGMVTAVNPMMEDIVGRSEAELKGQHILKIAPMIGENTLNQVLEKGKDCSLSLEWNQTSVFAVLAPILYDGRMDGAIITCHKRKKTLLVNRGSENRLKKEKSCTLPPLVRFEDLIKISGVMQNCVRLAGLYALSEQPVVLHGEPGTEKRMLAESMHNSSSRRTGPFLDVSCAGLSGEEQHSLIFGERGAVLQAQGGTLFLQEAEELTAANQYRLFQLIRYKLCPGAELARQRKMDVRVMITVCEPLAQLMEQGRISQELSYLLSGLELTVPPLRERKEDLEQKLQNTIRDTCERYSRYHVLTSGAKKILLDYPWYGNLFQVESFCERLILTASKRSIDEIAVKNLLKELYPKFYSVQTAPENQEHQFREDRAISGIKEEEERWDCRETQRLYHGERNRIQQALYRNGGNRKKTAQELGISKATLWRRMKKYEIEIK